MPEPGTAEKTTRRSSIGKAETSKCSPVKTRNSSGNEASKPSKIRRQASLSGNAKIKLLGEEKPTRKSQASKEKEFKKLKGAKDEPVNETAVTVKDSRCNRNRRTNPDKADHRCVAFETLDDFELNQAVEACSKHDGKW